MSRSVNTALTCCLVVSLSLKTYLTVVVVQFLKMEETPADRQLTSVTDVLPMFASMAASITLGFLVKDFLGGGQVSQPRIDVLDFPGREEKNSHQFVAQNFKPNSLTTPPPSPRPTFPGFEYQQIDPAYYDKMIQQKIKLINLLRKQQQQQSFQDQHLVMKVKYKEVINDGPEDFDFQPFFPNYKAKPPRLLEKKDYDSFQELMEIPQVPVNNKKEWEKFLDTKTVIAGVDIVDVNDYYSDYFEK